MSISVTPNMPKPGWIYCIANPAIPGRVKIGCTSQEVDERMAELDTTGVAMPFSLIGKWLSADILRDEKAIHEMFAHARTRQSREWFDVSSAELIPLVCQIGAYMTDQNGAYYAPPQNERELYASDWLIKLGIIDAPIDMHEMPDRPRESGQNKRLTNLTSYAQAAAVFLCGLITSAHILDIV